jgi:hypothetical protein
VERGKNGDMRGFPEGSRALYGQGRLGLGWTSADAIGHHGRCAGIASCAKSRGQVGGVGGWPVQPRHGRFQSGWGRNGVPWGRVGESWCRARASWRQGLDAVLMHVQRGAGGCVRAWEWHTCSRRTGRLSGAGLTWSGCVALSASVRSISWN